MLPTVTVDPSAIWIVDAADSQILASDLIKQALKWMQPNATGPLPLYISSRSVAALTEAGAFPAGPRLAAMLTSLGLQGVVSSKDLANSVGRFLANNLWLEDLVQLKDALYQDISITPDPTLAINDNALQLASRDAIGLVSLLCTRVCSRHSVYGFPRQSVACQPTSVSTKLDILHVGDDEQVIEETVEAELHLLGSPRDWSRALSSLQIWKDADEPLEVEVAIWLAASELAKQSGCGLRAFRVGSEFLESIRNNGALGVGPFAEATLSKCAQTVLQASSLRPKPLRTAKNANAPIRVRQRDKAKAWRQHVTKRHEALRLMYWELPNGHIEFASLEVKAESSIDDGQPLPVAIWSP